MSQLLRLMHHIIKWKFQPEKRSRSWSLTIKDARREIKYWKNHSPSLNDTFMQSIWQEMFMDALDDAKTETGISVKDIETLTWQEVFEEEYMLEIE